MQYEACIAGLNARKIEKEKQLFLRLPTTFLFKETNVGNQRLFRNVSVSHFKRGHIQ